MIDAEKLLAQVLLELSHVRSELAELKALVAVKPINPEGVFEGWTGGKNAARLLQSDGVTSDSHLKRLRQSGVLNELKGCVRNTSEGDRPTWQYHVPSCRKALKKYFATL